VQPSAGPDLPHTRSRMVHWLTTAAALGAVLGATALTHSSEATAIPAHTRAAIGTATGPDPDKASYPIDCGPWEVTVVTRESVDFDGDGSDETVAHVRCATGAGTPPSALYVLAGSADGGSEPRVAETLVAPQEQLTVENLTVRGRTVSARLRGYSSDAVPRCCPDMKRGVEWDWEDGRFALHTAPVTKSV
jgi:hypothetical protein